VGGGGYDLGNAMRAWTMAWMAMVGAEPPDVLPPPPAERPGAAAEMPWPADFWSSAAPQVAWQPGDEAIDAIIAEVQRGIFPHHGI
jgi:hypothetical protein